MRDRKLIIEFLAVLCLLGIATGAWACTKQANMIGLNPQAAPPFVQVMVLGKLVDRVSAPIEIRWNSLGGELLGTVDSSQANRTGEFSVPVRLPHADPGIYYLVVEGDDYGVARAAIEVTSAGSGQSVGIAPAGRTASSDVWSGLSASRPGPPPSDGSAFDQSSSQMKAGVILFATGVLGTLAGIAGGWAALSRARSSTRRQKSAGP